MNASEHLETQVWKHPQNYCGFSPDGDFLVLSRHRDSELLGRVNWDVACESLKAKAYDNGTEGFATRPTVYHWRARCSMVGWIEYLCVRADAPDSVKNEAGEIVCSLAADPVSDDDKFSEVEWNAVCEYWEGCDVSDRVYNLQKAGLCIFAARRDTLPGDPTGSLYERLREGL